MLQRFHPISGFSSYFLYEPQEELPVDNAEMVEAWTDAGTAIWD